MTGLHRTWFMLMVLFVLLASQVGAQSVLEPDQPGPYKVGTMTLEFTDSSRDDRPLQVMLWYPADQSGTSLPHPPDVSGAPYPLIIWSHGFGGAVRDGAALARHLVSRGYVVVGIIHPDVLDDWDWPEVDRPLDDLFVLDELASSDDERLAGLINFDQGGILGFSFGATGALQVAGARVDLANFLAWCETTPVEEQGGYCEILPAIDQLEQYQAAHIPLAEDGLWSSTTDPRIRAAMVMSPCAGQEIGARGLAEVSIPVFIAAGTSDNTCPYLMDGRFMFDQIGRPDSYLLTLEGTGHDGIFSSDSDLAPFFATALFDTYLKGVTGSDQFLSPEAAEQFNNVTLEVGHTGG